MGPGDRIQLQRLMVLPPAAAANNQPDTVAAATPHNQQAGIQRVRSMFQQQGSKSASLERTNDGLPSQPHTDYTPAPHNPPNRSVSYQGSHYPPIYNGSSG